MNGFTLKQVLSSAAAIVIVAFLVAAMGHFYLKSNKLAENLNTSQLKVAEQMTTIDKQTQKTTELESTIKRVVSTSNKIEQAKPQLVKWVYKHSRISKKMAEEIVDNVKESSCPLFLLALMRTESNFNPTAVSSKGAMGLGQIMPMHKKALKEAGILEEMRDVFNIPTAVKATEFIWELKMSVAGGDINKALALYLGTHNTSYVNRILKDYFHLNYLCRKPLMKQKAELVLTSDTNKNKEKAIKMQNEVQKALNDDPVLHMPSILSAVEVVYVVKKGDYLSRIAHDAYGLTSFAILNTIQDRNPEIENLDVIEIDQRITLPVVKIGSAVLTPRLPATMR